MALPEASVGLCWKPRGTAGIGRGVRPLHLGTQACPALSPPPRLSLSLNLNMSRTSRSMASQKLFASSFLCLGNGVGTARGHQGKLSDSGSGGRLRGRSETCTRDAAGLRDPWGQDTDSLDRDVQGFLFRGSVSPGRPSLPVDTGRRNASEKLWGRCGPELRAPLLFCS